MVPNCLPVTLASEPDGSFRVSFTARKSPAGARHQVQVGGGLTTCNAADPDIPAITRDHEAVTVTYLPPPDRLFIRVEALPE